MLAAVALVFGALTPLALQPAAGSEAEEPTTFTVAMDNEVDSFNPFLGIEAESYEMWALMYDYLIGYSMADMSPEPTGLAEDWETSEDGLTWTFTVRDGVTFSDGEPLTAADVAYTYNRILDGGAEAATWSSYLTSVEKVTAPDERTVVLELSQPNAVLPLLPIPIIPEHVWRDVDEKAVKTFANEPTDGDPVIGSGPFELVEGTAGGPTARFQAREDYWKGSPHIDEVVYRVFKSKDSAVQALIKGEVDYVADVPPLQVDALQGQEGITTNQGDSPGFDEIAFNVGAVNTKTGEPIGDGHEALKDPDFRFALGFAIDRQRIVDTAYQGSGTPGDSIVPPTYDNWRWEPPAEDAFTFDPERADQLLTEAGYETNSGGERLMPDGSDFGTLRLFARSESDTSVTVMDLFKEWLADLGIDSEITAMESNRLTNVILDGEFDAFEWGWYVEPDPDSMLSYLTCDQLASWNDAWYCNEEYDRLYREQNQALDDAERVAAVKRMQEILYYDAPYLVTAYGATGEAIRTDRWACLQSQPDPGGIWLFQYGVTNYLQMRPADQAGDCDGVTNAVGAVADGTDASGSGAAGEVESSSSSSWVLPTVAALVLVLLAAGGLMAFRRRASAGERE
ncbi:MAG: Oligopeptide ABC transporter, periplasmic oligopeptide-binding protein OppA [uncultured Nocardioidaceae bacterium]|uniref:Oligopeptide ABC transporter, periplasmic oligopeptide-binding protein OppA n=1 Tax=uncultured Nocardioidaceae bacterium TaxID=253824 RepID=A0A6J4M2L5_9ACTN|nr:MAG: Oligopeptide ABC transporter, periplasmic oligopeptide-binding protein OppA [uncultured Nocardioidaceae bacterium]